MNNWKWWVILAALLGLYLILCFKASFYICERQNKSAAEANYTLNIAEDGCGWCVSHDECGPWCPMWRKLVYNGIIKDTGVHKLTTDKVLKNKWLNEEWKKTKGN